MLVTAAAASAVASGGSWSRPRELPGPPDSTGGGSFTALSCASRSDCTAVGIYHVRSGRYRFFAVTDRRGVWGKALGIAAPIAGKKVNLGGTPLLSCASAGNCAAGDFYWTSSQSGAFVVSEKNGTWGKARKVRSTPTAISCPAPGDCTAALARGYLLTERHGTWRKAFPVPGLAALRHGQPTDFRGDLLPITGQLHRGKKLPGPRRQQQVVRHHQEERDLGQGSAGHKPPGSRPRHRRAVVPLGRQLRRGRVSLYAGRP